VRRASVIRKLAAARSAPRVAAAVTVQVPPSIFLIFGSKVCHFNLDECESRSAREQEACKPGVGTRTRFRPAETNCSGKSSGSSMRLRGSKNGSGTGSEDRRCREADR
jgi:hypothetical protein